MPGQWRLRRGHDHQVDPARLLDCSSVEGGITTGNGSSGATASSTAGPSRLTLERVVSSNNHDGGVLAKGPSAIAWVSNTTMTGNSYGFFPAAEGGLYISFGNNRVTANSTADGAPNTTLPQI